MPTKNSKVCILHFVSGIAINNPESIDYVPSVNVGYEKHVSARETQTSKRAMYWSNSDLATEGALHTPSIAFRHLPPNSARFSYATEGALLISAQLSTDAVNGLGTDMTVEAT